MPVNFPPPSSMPPSPAPTPAPGGSGLTPDSLFKGITDFSKNIWKTEEDEEPDPDDPPL